ncbi:hypothetical protein [Thiosocius teredinicola]|uniref:hypothetical protein n=1 Tax=Thiosocius teredinicola TaxID=1973002 RepID=UPI000F792861
MDKNTTHLAGEFLVAGELSRRGLSVSITFGNAKSVDIVAQSQTNTYSIDAKAVRSKSNWPLSRASVVPTIYYVFVYLGSERKIKNGESAEYFVVPGTELVKKGLVSQWAGGRSGVTYKALSSIQQGDPWSVFK